MRSEVPRSSLGVASSAASPRSSSSWGVRGGRWPLLSAELGANEVESLERSVVMSSCTCACGIMLLLAMTAVGVCEDHGHRIFLPVARRESASGGRWCSHFDHLFRFRKMCNRNSMFGDQATRVLQTDMRRRGRTEPRIYPPHSRAFSASTCRGSSERSGGGGRGAEAAVLLGGGVAALAPADLLVPPPPTRSTRWLR